LGNSLSDMAGSISLCFRETVGSYLITPASVATILESLPSTPLACAVCKRDVKIGFAPAKSCERQVAPVTMVTWRMMSLGCSD
jgi:hypothetical protein